MDAAGVSNHLIKGFSTKSECFRFFVGLPTSTIHLVWKPAGESVVLHLSFSTKFLHIASLKTSHKLVVGCCVRVFHFPPSLFLRQSKQEDTKCSMQLVEEVTFKFSPGDRTHGGGLPFCGICTVVESEPYVDVTGPYNKITAWTAQKPCNQRVDCGRSRGSQPFSLASHHSLLIVRSTTPGILYPKCIWTELPR